MSEEKTNEKPLQVERLLLGCCLLDGQDTFMLAVKAGVTDASFTHPFHAKIFGAMHEMLARGGLATADGILLALQQAGLLDVAGCQHVNEIAKEACTTANAREFISQVRADEIARRVNKAGGQLKELAQDAPHKPEDIVQEAQETLSRALDWTASDSRSWRSRVSDMLTQNTAQAKADVSFGLGDIDKSFVPMGSGQLVVIAGRPSTGKSSLLRQIISHHAQGGRRCFLASLEMTVEEIVNSMAATKCGINQRYAEQYDRERSEFRAAVGDIAQWPLELFDQFAAGLDVIVSRIRAEHRRSPFSLVALDHLHAMRDALGGRNVNTNDAISRVTKTLKALAGELHCPVVLLAQLSRLSEREDRRPRLDDLRGSGSIEEDADKVIFLHRPETNPLTSASQPISSPVLDTPRFYLDLIQAKGRAHGTAEVAIMFNRPITKFEQIAKTQEP